MNQKKEKQNVNVVGVGILDDPHIKGKTQKGITLIALVITIIILLILAGVAITMVLGDDGIIKQAEGAKEANNQGTKNDEDSIQAGEGNIDLHTEGTIANKVQVGDYIEYKYNEPEDGYATQNVNTTTQTFSSAERGNAEVKRWKVLSKKNGIIKLISEEPIFTTDGIILTGKNGWKNGEKVLNDLCKTLYSSNIGTARSINIDDINEIANYNPKETILSIGEKEVKYGTTIKDVADSINFDMVNFPTVTPEDGKNIGDYGITYYMYEGKSKINSDSKEYEMLFNTGNKNYWLASSCVGAGFKDEINEKTYVQFYMRCVSSNNVMTQALLYNEGNNVEEKVCTSFGFRPIVVLKSGLHVEDEKNENGEWVIKQ